MNKVILTGRLTAAPELRQTRLGGYTVTFNIAVDEGKSKDGEKITQFPRCIAFDKTAEMICNHFAKGDGIGLEGRIITGSYVDKNNVKIYTTDVAVSRVEFPLSRKNDTQGSGSAADGASATPAQGNAWQYPQSDPAYAPAPQGQTNKGYLPQDFDQISSADLPF
jgi:single-strand DNA-binding protein